MDIIKDKSRVVFCERARPCVPDPKKLGSYSDTPDEGVSELLPKNLANCFLLLRRADHPGFRGLS
jgi:hypothetical protein